mmetsp:Transcript_2219/g.5140  ORF Transcript_2219/g.5140 Transcript_2219/m.5140 type:complete len:112 (-) Transcript_2219:102-437(-)|eukprot:CAMPEP_0171491174 /NCGR_PEP_ID=MMETSP0958-20121227/3715_1 /TAXON_ID=87120 /ORGANISM="Aurantiochytrium limacinum, Strain ATCCMYA-1381" /LENGTH=111 /DNA_ID=CAMNT_0012024567 /DNA_START=140 /DNA_END=475 /DNA_ORIENTATION=+
MSAPARQLSRHITADGRNSLRAHLFGPRQGSFIPDKIRKPELVPLGLCIGGALTLGGTFGLRHLYTSPNVTTNKAERKKTLLTQNTERAKRQIAHRASMRNLAHVVDRPNP